MYIVALDGESVVQRQVDISKLLKSEVVQPIPMRDLTVNKKVDDNESKGLMDVRGTKALKKGEKTHIEDISSSEFQIIDTQDKLVKVIDAMKKVGYNNTLNHSNDEQMWTIVEDVILKWHQFSNDEKITKFYKYVSHELNYFIFKRDRAFFNSVLREYISNKLDKTFMDWYLLSMSN
jgi:hypothetical protein